jgi:hypothetical protein
LCVARREKLKRMRMRRRTFLFRKRMLFKILTQYSWITQSKTCCCCCWIEFYCKKLGARHKPLSFFLIQFGV